MVRGPFLFDHRRDCCYNIFLMFPFLNPRLPDFVLGLTIGLSLALACHWAAWAFR